MLLIRFRPWSFASYRGRSAHPSVGTVLEDADAGGDRDAVSRESALPDFPVEIAGQAHGVIQAQPGLRPRPHGVNW